MQIRKLIINMYKMVIRYDSAHRGLIYLLIPLFSSFSFFIITIANSFVERGVTVASAPVVQVVIFNS